MPSFEFCLLIMLEHVYSTISGLNYCHTTYFSYLSPLLAFLSFHTLSTLFSCLTDSLSVYLLSWRTTLIGSVTSGIFKRSETGTVLSILPKWASSAPTRSRSQWRKFWNGVRFRWRHGGENGEEIITLV